MFAIVQELLVALAACGFLAFLTGVFVVLARLIAPRLLGRDDGSAE